MQGQLVPLGMDSYYVIGQGMEVRHKIRSQLQKLYVRPIKACSAQLPMQLLTPDRSRDSSEEGWESSQVTKVDSGVTLV